MKTKTELVGMSEIFKRLETLGFEDWCYYSGSGDLEFLAGSGATMNDTTLEFLKKQGFVLMGIWLGCTHKVVFSFRANRQRFRKEAGY